MLTDQQAMETQQDSNDQPQSVPEEKPSNLRPYILIGIFVILLIFLVLMYLNSDNTSQTPPHSVPSPTAASREPTGSKEVPMSPSIIDLETIKITIVSNKETEILANALKNLLTQSGFLNVATIDSTNPIPAKSSLLFAKSIPDETRQKVIEEIKKIFPDILVQESQETDLTIAIIIGKS